MKAMVYHRYGPPDVLTCADVPQPTPGDNEVLVRVHAAGVNAGDWHLLRGSPFLVRLMFGLRRPKRPIIGSDVAGQIDAVGSKVTRLKPGDAVFGELSSSGFGAFAEYACAREEALVRKPDNLSFAEAAGVPLAALTALQGLRDVGQIQPGQKVLVNGASGGVGSFAVQLARSLGAEVTGVCSTSKVDMVRALGPDHVIDYTQEDVTRSGRQYDLILDAAAYRPFSDYQRALTPTGTYVLVGGATKRLLQVMIMGAMRSKKGGQQFKTFILQSKLTNLQFIKELVEAGKLKPAIDRCYPLEELPTALRQLEAGQARGKAVIALAHG
ncbi:NAD(P)-dependent alcohol dehydrogenase [Oscillochloris sp. ZM17-4]|uniref:NAD(P)-dependent alcohol dehydrogenase n=1 Tax=Oscillochloris sp. ZM17-4 TaxID=2866714 RepID=UPI001C73A74C|nr:NAD(P)-dependent alcohol dehydrogenase [Oscillochloris sp. ZM17-4]MBX0329675.1 NAD(P)-dependent alcohol dehydrogenase [Oscillochloris sp. ZM17-4]